jgi:hypothetical protein
VVFFGGRHLELREGRRIDVPGWKGAQATGIEGAHPSTYRPPVKGVRGFDPAEPPAADKAAALFSPVPSAQARRQAVDRPEAGNVPSSTELLEAG